MGLAKSKPKAAPLDDATRTPSGHALPNPVHLRLSVDQLPPGRLIIVGDIHGCYSELLALLEACSYKPGCDALFLLGDLVNKGPMSPQVLDFAAQHNAYVVRGNHDEAAITAYDKLQRGETVKVGFVTRQHAAVYLYTNTTDRSTV